MLKKEIHSLLDKSKPYGWVLEPDAKRILEISGLPVPRFSLGANAEEAIAFAEEIGYPVVAKVVSPEVVHKTEVKGVAVGIQNAEELQAVFKRFARAKAFAGMLVEQMVAGQELIVGGKIDAQFGPVVLLGMGGTGVEIYKDTALRMAPIQPKDAVSMVDSLTAAKVLKGFRGEPGIDMEALAGLMTAFSELLMELGDRIESIDLNPVLCSPESCVVADARIMLMSNEDKDADS